MTRYMLPKRLLHFVYFGMVLGSIFVGLELFFLLVLGNFLLGLLLTGLAMGWIAAIGGSLVTAATPVTEEG